MITDRARRGLGKDLAGILRGTDKQRAAFLDEAVIALESYREILAAMPAARGQQQPRAAVDRFEALGILVGRLAAMVKRLDARDVAWLRSAMKGGDVDAAQEWLRASADRSETIKQATTAIVRGYREARTRKRTPVQEILISSLATAYGTVYGKPASPDPDGIFCRSYQAIRTCAKIPDSVGRKKMTEILGRRLKPAPFKTKKRERGIKANASRR